MCYKAELLSIQCLAADVLVLESQSKHIAFWQGIQYSSEDAFNDPGHTAQRDRSKDIPLTYVRRWALLIGLIVVVAASAGGWFFSPKGENQT